MIKVPPMQTLSEALAAAASKFKPALVPGRCSLQHNKKAVDLNTPFRLLNVPAGSKLEIFISSECCHTWGFSLASLGHHLWGQSASTAVVCWALPLLLTKCHLTMHRAFSCPGTAAARVVSG